MFKKKIIFWLVLIFIFSGLGIILSNNFKYKIDNGENKIKKKQNHTYNKYEKKEYKYQKGDYKNFSKNFEEHDHEMEDLDIQDDAEIVYKIISGEKFIILSGKENENHKKIKKWLKVISPDDFSDENIQRLIIYNSNEGREGKVGAFVIQNKSNFRKYDMYVNMALFEEGEKDLIFTIIHEFAHIFTLNANQIDVNVEEEKNCQSYFAKEGCAKNNSYLNSFYAKFWAGKFNVKDGKEINYNKSPSSFVTYYAATNPGEDIAESFANFIFEDKDSSGKVSGQKNNFFYDYRWLREIRSSIRSNIDIFYR